MPTDTEPSTAPEPTATSGFMVVMDGEDMYSIWPEELDLPEGWRPAGFSGSREACLSHIEAVWTDMRPLSLRRAMAVES